MTISGGRTKQLDIFCHVTGFTTDFLSFIVVELIRFFHGALHISIWLLFLPAYNSMAINGQAGYFADSLQAGGPS